MFTIQLYPGTRGAPAVFPLAGSGGSQGFPYGARGALRQAAAGGGEWGGGWAAVGCLAVRTQSPAGPDGDQALCAWSDDTSFVGVRLVRETNLAYAARTTLTLRNAATR